MGKLAESETSWIRRPLIHSFAAFYNISLQDAERDDLDDYHSFNDFFTRALSPDARPMPLDQNLVVSPVDGTLSQFGAITDGRLYQAKGKHYSLDSLLGKDPIARDLAGGWFSTLYLAPSDYHRIHMPFGGRLKRCLAIPGELFSVNAVTTEGLADLFCRNERLVCIFETASGPLVVVLVGAMIVASIETVWGEPHSPYRKFLKIEKSSQESKNLELHRGDELGRFLLGSTVIVCLPKGCFNPLVSLYPGQPMKLGEPLGNTY